VELLTSCDEGVLMLCELLGWREELELLICTQIPEWSIETANISLEKDERVLRNQRRAVTDGYAQPEAEAEANADEVEKSKEYSQT
jgi:hypothetical protein